MSWQGSAESALDDAIDMATAHASCPGREAAEDYLLDVLITRRCGEVEEWQSTIHENFSAYSLACGGTIWAVLKDRSALYPDFYEAEVRLSGSGVSFNTGCSGHKPSRSLRRAIACMLRAARWLEEREKNEEFN